MAETSRKIGYQYTVRHFRLGRAQVKPLSQTWYSMQLLLALFFSTATASQKNRIPGWRMYYLFYLTVNNDLFSAVSLSDDYCGILSKVNKVL